MFRGKEISSAKVDQITTDFILLLNPAILLFCWCRRRSIWIFLNRILIENIYLEGLQLLKVHLLIIKAWKQWEIIVRCREGWCRCWYGGRMLHDGSIIRHKVRITVVSRLRPRSKKGDALNPYSMEISSLRTHRSLRQSIASRIAKFHKDQIPSSKCRWCAESSKSWTVSCLIV